MKISKKFIKDILIAESPVSSGLSSAAAILGGAAGAVRGAKLGAVGGGIKAIYNLATYKKKYERKMAELRDKLFRERDPYVKDGIKARMYNLTADFNKLKTTGGKIRGVGKTILKGVGIGAGAGGAIGAIQGYKLGQEVKRELNNQKR